MTSKVIHHQLPNGTTTTSLDTYVKAWRKLIKPLAKATNSYCFGYDPDLSFCSRVDNHTWKIDVETAILLAAAIKKV